MILFHICQKELNKNYADDSLLYRSNMTTVESEILQKDLNTLPAMEFHSGKCQELRITNKQNPNQVFCNIRDIPWVLLPLLNTLVIGIYIDSKVS